MVTWSNVSYAADVFVVEKIAWIYLLRSFQVRSASISQSGNNAARGGIGILHEKLIFPGNSLNSFSERFIHMQLACSLTALPCTKSNPAVCSCQTRLDGPRLTSLLWEHSAGYPSHMNDWLPCTHPAYSKMPTSERPVSGKATLHCQKPHAHERQGKESCSSAQFIIGTIAHAGRYWCAGLKGYAVTPQWSLYHRKRVNHEARDSTMTMCSWAKEQKQNPEIFQA